MLNLHRMKRLSAVMIIISAQLLVLQIVNFGFKAISARVQSPWQHREAALLRVADSALCEQSAIMV